MSVILVRNAAHFGLSSVLSCDNSGPCVGFSESSGCVGCFMCVCAANTSVRIQVRTFSALLRSCAIAHRLLSSARAQERKVFQRSASSVAHQLEAQ